MKSKKKKNTTHVIISKVKKKKIYILNLVWFKYITHILQKVRWDVDGLLEVTEQQQIK